MAVADRLEISPVIAVLLSLMMQTGVIPQVLAKVSVHAVTTPPPTVMVPWLSSPTTDGLVPHVDTEGLGLFVTICPFVDMAT